MTCSDVSLKRQQRQIKDGDSLTLSDKGRGRTQKRLLRFYRLLILFKQSV